MSTLKKQIKFHSLTSSNEFPIDKVYEDAFMCAMYDKNVRNIAVTGPYGAGKSSLINSLLKRHYVDEYNKKVLRVSLARFNKNSTEDGESQERSIEKDLLLQIFYKPKSIENSKIRRLNEYLSFNPLPIIAFLVAYICLFYPNKIQELYGLDTPLNQYPSIPVISTIILLIISGYAIRNIFKLSKKLGVSKLKAVGAEIEINNDSLLSEFTDELINLFDKTEYDTLVIEDLDRFDSMGIFTKLREINTLINQSDFIRDKKTVKFIYAIKDDIFIKSEDRIKFFDFIIPVIPVVTTANAYDQLYESLGEPKEVEWKGVLKGIAVYLCDKRMQANIVNEYNTYKAIIASNGSSDKKLKLSDKKFFAIIVYKNLCPFDYSNLCKGKGFLHALFNKRKKILVESCVKEMELNLQKTKDLIQRLNSELFKNERELNASYVAHIFASHPNVVSLTVNSERKTISELLNNTDLMVSLASSKEVLSGRHYNMSSSNPTSIELEPFQVYEEQINPDQTYLQRLETIKNIPNQIDLESEAETVRDEINRTRNKQLRVLLREEPEFDIFDINSDSNEYDAVRKNEITDNLGLIKFLIKEGHVEEDYESYLSYFRGTSKNDKEFIDSVWTNNPLAFEHKLDVVSDVFDEIKDKNFDTRAVLNFDLFDYLLDHSSRQEKLNQHLEHWEYLFESEFLVAYIYHTDDCYISRLVEKLITNERFIPDFIDKYAELHLSTNREIGHKLIKALMKSLSQSWVKNLISKNNIQSFTNFIYRFDELAFDGLKDLNVTEIERFFGNLNLTFEDISNCKNSDVFTSVIKCNAFRININNIETLLNIESVEHKLAPVYSNIRKNLNDEINKYISDNIDDYVNNVLFELGGYSDTEDGITKLLNLENLSQELATEMIERVDFKLSTLDQVDQELWWILLKNDRVKPSWGSILTYFEKSAYTLDENLVGFINLNSGDKALFSKQLQLHKNAEGKVDKELSKPVSLFCEELINSSEISDITFSNVCNSIPWKYNNIDFIGVSENGNLMISNKRLETLLENRSLGCTKSNFDLLCTTIPEKAYQLIEQNFDKFIKDANCTVKPDNLFADDFINLLQLSKLTDEQKFSLIDLIPNDYYDGEKSLSKAVVSTMLNQKHKLHDITKIMKPMSLVELDDQIQLFIKYSSKLTRDDTKTYIAAMGEFGTKLVSKKPQKLPLSDTNLIFAELLKKKNIAGNKPVAKQIRLNPWKALVS